MTLTEMSKATGGVSLLCGCCNLVQKEIIISLAVTIFLCALTWKRLLLAPIKLIAVFLHEFGHASATWLTGGKVVSIEVNERYGGLTRFQGGVQWIVYSAGYTGSVVWGSFFLLMTWNHVALRVAAVFFILAAVATIVCLRIFDATVFWTRCAVSLFLRVSVLCVAGVVAGLWVLESYIDTHVSPLRWCMVSFGTMCVLYAVYDCFEDVVCRKVDNEDHKSDAVLLHNAVGGSPYFWGSLWALISVAAAVAAVYGTLVLSEKNCSAKA